MAGKVEGESAVVVAESAKFARMGEGEERKLDDKKAEGFAAV
jgi:hypothetical protein